MTGPRPLGDAGRGKHTGRKGWLGGKHRRRGCLDMVAVASAVAVAASLIVKGVRS